MALLMYVNNESPPVYDFIGTGADGDGVVSSTSDLSAVSVCGRPTGDMAAWRVGTVNSDNVVLAQSVSALAAGDEVVLVCLQGNQTNSVNVGNWETFTVDSVASPTVNFTTSKTKYYGNGTTSDGDIGQSHQDMKVMLMRVPNYNNFTVNPGFAAQAKGYDWGTWNAYWKYGLFFMRVKGTCLIQGSVTMNERGYIGRTTSGSVGLPGGTYHGIAPSNTLNRYYGGGGGGDRSSSGNCGGGGHGTAGQAWSSSQGGNTYGVADIDGSGKIYMGSAGGGCDPSPTRRGARGGGMIMIFANELIVEGYIGANGGNGAEAGGVYSGSGAGGSIVLKAGSFSSDGGGATITAVGGTTAADGGAGRTAIYYGDLVDSVVGTPTPYSEQLT